MIGPGGENLIRYACIMSGLHDAAGRGGAGAVMGSKNLKAIAVRGSNRPKVATPEGVKELREWLLKNREIWSGTASGGTMDFGYAMEQAVTEGNLSVNNFRDGIFPDAKLIERNSIRIGMDGCFACPVHCKKVCKVDGPYNVDPIYGGPEYETLGTLGTNCGISDIKAIAKGNELCQANSLDTISTGMVISFAMECFENGLLSTEDTSGIDLRFGNAAAMIKTIELIAKREAIGNLLAEGSAKAAKIIGKGAKKFSMDVKGLEIPMHEPRLKQILGLGYMVNPHGADHNCNVHDTMIAVKGRSLEWLKPLMGELEPLSVDDVGPLKVAIFRMTQLDRILNDSLVLCHWVPYPFTRRVNVTAAVTGWDVGALELLRVAERTITMFRLINIREGFTAEDDKLPERFFQPKSGALADKPLNHEKMERAKSYYYTLMGWDAQSGIPLKEKVEELLIP
jgi:aldehyde:ferredoxin oxidoreductase